MTPTTTATPKLFASIRASRDLTLAAFAAVLLAAFALHAGAFLPALPAPRAPAQTAAAPAAAPSLASGQAPAPCAG
jgi:hypothetical protein